MITDRQWSEARRITRRAIRSSLHCSIASRNPGGSAHVTPIGSVLLGSHGTGIYFDVFNTRLAHNVDLRPEVEILAVDSSRTLWLPGLLRGAFARQPAVRLIGTVGEQRASTAEEIARFHRIVGPLLRTRGGALLWRSLPRVRDIEIHRVERITLGAMTAASRSR
ncbi:pyridoxamine 5'-phosphate oxidase [Gordonia hydrophobica]|uniref:Pyridoxamine 5'-phosphate oxidase family protein n=1 Tax=Gordonia hydrophobica TaxID=40516 RepID=A0ABZ2U193_9ACTN|nr:pyridoxamine 5'-phosphate oxidase [Gordonia hydrophobica]MBM7368522.1 hypothetical protein [Gordonia hydrophobica]